MSRIATSLVLACLTVAACDTGRTVPRLVAAPPLPERAIIVELGSPRTSAEPVRDGGYSIRTDATASAVPGGVVIERGGVEVVIDVAAYLDHPSGLVASRTLDSIEAREFIGRAVVLDLHEKTAADLDAVLDVQDIERFESAHGAIGKDDFVVLWTGYAELLEGFRDPSTAKTHPTHSPGFSREAMRALVGRGVRRVATDAPRLTAATDPTFTCDELLFSRGGFAVVNLSRLERLPVRDATLVVSPLQLAGASFAPARVLALVPRDPSKK